MSAHTPGPWQYVFEGGTTAFITETDGSTIICIRTTENTTAHKNLAANACLIAAAPELAATLAAVADFWAGGDAPPELESRIHAALRTAGVRP